MNSKLAVSITVAALAAPAYGYDYSDTARVVSTVPIYQTVNEPSQQCWNETVTHYQESRPLNGGAILGGLTGGLLGAQVGKGNGRIVAAATGAAIGALVGDRLDGRGSTVTPVSRVVQRCQVTDNYRQVVSGYQVTYVYNGRHATVVLPYDPGPRVRIGVGIAENGVSGAYVLPQSTTIRPGVTRITYADPRNSRAWDRKPYKRPKHDRDWDD